ncbi:MAG: bifunctional folylpolyglutamate synthase/dihydrofolate synthase [Clostridiales bacterium]|nr:bifunctional folylpolyglutamate synthase/dihydrofolate synthase [Clostridiales bacterium]
MNYIEAMEYIGSIQRYGSVLGLQNMQRLCERLGNPQESLKFVHIAGTNGKGSVLAYVSTVLWTAGYKVGRYISPTIQDYRERFQINGKSIAKTKFCAYLEQVKQAVWQMEAEGLSHPTPFEIETAIAFLYFADKKCDIVVLETGLGGRLDATNIISTTVCAVLTSISMDHMAVLGKSLEEIAKQKAGIIKDNCRVVSCRQKLEAAKVIEDTAKAHGARLTVADSAMASHIKYGLSKQSFSYGKYKKLEITMSGEYQIDNAVLALEVINALQDEGFKISEDKLRQGLLLTKWLGRFSVIGKKPLFIIDGAHNEDAAKRLAESVRFYFTNKRIIYIMGVLADKEYDKIISETYELAQHIIAIKPPHNARALDAYELAAALKEYHNSVTVADSISEAVEMAYLLAGKDSDTVIIAFGSLSYLGELIYIVEHRDALKGDFHGRSE